MSMLQRFLLLFLIAFSIQAFLWRHSTILDQRAWIRTALAMNDWRAEMMDPFTQGYPGTLPLVVAIPVHRITDIPMEQAFRGSIAFLMAAAIAVSGLILYRMNPYTSLWLIAALAMAFNTLPATATPPSALAAPFVTLLVLYTWKEYMRPPGAYTYSALIYGVIAGFALLQRVDISAAFFVPLLLLLGKKFGWRYGAYSILVSLSVFAAFNPFLWYAPVEHLSQFWVKIVYHAFEYEDARRWTPLFVIQKSIFAIIGLAVALVAARIKPLAGTLLVRFPLYIAGITFFVVTALLFATYQASWYLFPIIQIWEVILVILFMYLIPHLQAPEQWSGANAFSKYVNRFAEGFLLFMFVVPFIQYLTLPAIIFAFD